MAGFPDSFMESFPTLDTENLMCAFKFFALTSLTLVLQLGLEPTFAVWVRLFIPNIEQTQQCDGGTNSALT